MKTDSVILSAENEYKVVKDSLLSFIVYHETKAFLRHHRSLTHFFTLSGLDSETWPVSGSVLLLNHRSLDQ